MANRLTIRFYTVERVTPAGFSLQQALENVDAKQPHSSRQIQLAANYIVRLERYEDDAGELTGEFIRVQTTDFPFEVEDDGVSPLQTDGPLGNGIAFRFRPMDSTLAIQYDTRVVSPGRAMDYLQQCDGRANFRINPKIDEENWRRFMDGEVRKLRVGVASPDHLGMLENGAAAAGHTFRELGQVYGAPVITIELGMGRRNGALTEAAKVLASEMSRLFRSNEGDIRSLKAGVKSQDGVPVEEINLIDEVLSDHHEINLPNNDPDHNYAIRKNFLRDALNRHGNV